jgi:kinesin family protein 18/19
MKNEDLINTSFNNNKFKEINKINNEQVNSNNNIGSFKVYIRIKPHLQNEKQKTRDSNINRINAINKTLTKDTLINETENEKIQMIKIEKNILYLEDVKNHKNNKTFLFDNIFNESTNNENIFNDAIKPMIDKILLGYNFTTLAYGVTGTGKTYTIFGDLTSNFGENGIIFKACDYLFEKIELNKKEENKSNIINYFIKISYFEIYNEIVRDLINENSSPLMLVEDPQKGVMCSNAKEVIINDSVELKKIINKSNKKRTMASTNLNQFSSRSHALLQMTLEKKVQRVDS